MCVPAPMGAIAFTVAWAVLVAKLRKNKKVDIVKKNKKKKKN